MVASTSSMFPQPLHSWDRGAFCHDLCFVSLTQETLISMKHASSPEEVQGLGSLTKHLRVEMSPLDHILNLLCSDCSKNTGYLSHTKAGTCQVSDTSKTEERRKRKCPLVWNLPCSRLWALKGVSRPIWGSKMGYRGLGPPTPAFNHSYSVSEPSVQMHARCRAERSSEQHCLGRVKNTSS